MKIYKIAISNNLLFHNTKSEYLGTIRQEGMSAGTFTDRPIDFGGDVWLAIDKSSLKDNNVQTHTYGKDGRGDIIAWEVNWDDGFIIPREEIMIADRRGKIIGKL